MITKKQLLDFGFVENKGDDTIICPMEKVLLKSEEGQLALVITHIRNQNDFAISTPTGEMIFVNGFESLAELKVIEKSITGWEGNI